MQGKSDVRRGTVACWRPTERELPVDPCASGSELLEGMYVRDGDTGSVCPLPVVCFDVGVRALDPPRPVPGITRAKHHLSDSGMVCVSTRRAKVASRWPSPTLPCLIGNTALLESAYIRQYLQILLAPQYQPLFISEVQTFSRQSAARDATHRIRRVCQRKRFPLCGLELLPMGESAYQSRVD